MGKIRFARLILLLFILVFLSCDNDTQEKNLSVLSTSLTEKADSLEISNEIKYGEDQIENNELGFEMDKIKTDFPEKPLKEFKQNPCFSIIIDDFGNYNNYMLDSLLVKFDRLPLEVAFAILPNLPYSEFVMDYVQEGRDLLLHVPMQPHNSKINAGGQVITINDDAITVLTKLNTFLKQLPYVIGINNHMGSKATEDADLMTSVSEWCRDNNLLFIDSATTPKSKAYSQAVNIGICTAKRDIFLDVPNPSKDTVDDYLNKMETLFSQSKDVLIITHASSSERLRNLIYFIEESEKLGYKLIPISEYTLRDKVRCRNQSDGLISIVKL